MPIGPRLRGRIVSEDIWEALHVCMWRQPIIPFTNVLIVKGRFGAPGVRTVNWLLLIFVFEDDGRGFHLHMLVHEIQAWDVDFNSTLGLPTSAIKIRLHYITLD